jgi:hypothetical protein
VDGHKVERVKGKWTRSVNRECWLRQWIVLYWGSSA